MALEIERKWLLKRLPNWDYDQVLSIAQYYVENQVSGIPFRLRKSTNTITGRTSYYHTEKMPISKGVFEETERTLGVEEFENLLQKYPVHKAIIKDRHIKVFDGHKYEIDTYKNITLTTLEVEFNSEETQITLPEIITREMIMELTGIKEFSNYALAVS